MASVNRGATSYVGVRQALTSSAGDLAAPDAVHGNSSLNSTAPAQVERHRGATIANRDFAVGLQTPPLAQYKMTGWYAAGSVWESWTSLGVPIATPPSGHTLTFVSYVLLSGGNAN